MLDFLNEYIFISLYCLTFTILFLSMRIMMYLVNEGLLTNIISYYLNSVLRIIIFCYLIYEIFPLYGVETKPLIFGLVWIFYWIPSLIATRDFFQKKTSDTDLFDFSSVFENTPQYIKQNEENKKLLLHDAIVQAVAIATIIIFSSNIYNFLSEIEFLDKYMSSGIAFIFQEKIVIHLIALFGLYTIFDSYRVIIFRNDY